MKNRLPRPRELAFFVAVSVVCTLVLGVTKQYDLGLALLGAPIFLVAALMGLRRSTELEAATVDVNESEDRRDADD